MACQIWLILHINIQIYLYFWYKMYMEPMSEVALTILQRYRDLEAAKTDMRR